MTDDTPDEPVSLEERRRQKAQDALLEQLKPIWALSEKMHEGRQKRIDFLAQAFDLEEPYLNRRVLDVLLFASEQIEEPPFKMFTDIGWMYRGYLLAHNVASDIRHGGEDWTKQAAKVLADAGDDWGHYLRERDYESLQSLLSVPDHEHAAVQEIVNGLALFSDASMKPIRYFCVVQAIVIACEGLKQATGS